MKEPNLSVTAAKRAPRKRVHPKAVKAQFPTSVHLRVAEEAMRSGPGAENRARQLAAMLVAMADRLADSATTGNERRNLSNHIDRLWYFDLAGSEKNGKSQQVFALVAAISRSAFARAGDTEGRLFYLNAGLLNFRTFFPERAARFDLTALTLFNKAVLLWDKRGPGAGKWQAIARVAESIGLPQTADQIRRTWEDMQRGPREPKGVDP